MVEPPPNPYSPPVSDIVGPVEKMRPRGRIDWVSLTCWPFAVALNVVVPVMFGGMITSDEGYIGMGLAIALCLIVGWGLCLARPMAARKLVLGSMLLAWTQLFPIIQMVAGMIALSLVGVSIDIATDESPSVGLVGAFIVSTLVATMLLPFAAGLGWLFAAILPRRWFEQPGD